MLAVAWLQLSLGEAHESDYGMMPLQRSDSLRWPPWAVGEGVADGDRRARHVSCGKGGGLSTLIPTYLLFATALPLKPERDDRGEGLF